MNGWEHSVEVKEGDLASFLVVARMYLGAFDAEERVSLAGRYGIGDLEAAVEKYSKIIGMDARPVPGVRPGRPAADGG